MQKTIDVVDMYKYGVYNVAFELIPLAWQGFKLFHLMREGWIDFKYLNDINNGINDCIGTVPNNKGGIYIFYIKGGIVPDIHNYIVYIGRAQLTEKQNLRKRCKEYWQKHNNKTETRVKIEKMMDLFGGKLHIKLLPLDNNNETIKELEVELVRAIRPPYNDEIPKITFSAPTSAF